MYPPRDVSDLSQSVRRLEQRGKLSEQLTRFLIAEDAHLASAESGQNVIYVCRCKTEEKALFFFVLKGRKMQFVIANEILAANKLDLLPAGKPQRKSVIDELRRTLPGLSYAPLVGISAAKRQGLEELLDAVAAVMEHLELEIPTGVLNRVLHRTFESLTPPVVGVAPLKFFYASMVGVKPPRVKLFVNDPAYAAPHYITYLAKQIRNAFDLDGVPLRMELCARPKNVESIRRNPAKRRK